MGNRWRLVGNRWRLVGNRWPLVCNRWRLVVNRWRVVCNRWRLVGHRWRLVGSHQTSETGCHSKTKWLSVPRAPPGCDTVIRASSVFSHPAPATPPPLLLPALVTYPSSPAPMGRLMLGHEHRSPDLRHEAPVCDYHNRKQAKAHGMWTGAKHH